MTTKAFQPKIVFFGTDAFSVPSLVKLMAEDWNIAAVVTKPDSHTGRGRQITQPAVKRLAEVSHIPVLQPDNLADIEDELTKLHAQIGIVVAYGKLIPPTMLDLFPHGLLNVHASLLPRYRGASPIESALLAGDEETGVTLMQLEAGLDTGPTYDVAKLQLDGTETRIDLYEQLAELGADLLANSLSAILQEQMVAVPQDESEAVTVGRIKKSDGHIDWTKPAAQIERQIRAYLGWPGSSTTMLGADLTITAAHVARDIIIPVALKPGSPYKTEQGELAVTTGRGVLIVDQLKPAGKRDMPARDFLAGHPLS